MFCPQCGQERVLMDTNFCSRCGFLLTGAAELVRTGGMLPRQMAPSEKKAPSARSRGLKQGLFIFLLTFLVVPIISIITVALSAEPFGVAIAAILLFVGGLLRVAYALLFESTEPLISVETDAAMHTFAGPRASPNALPPQRQDPASVYAPPQAGNWRDTNDLQPTRVSESATKLLNEDER